MGVSVPTPVNGLAGSARGLATSVSTAGEVGVGSIIQEHPRISGFTVELELQKQHAAHTPRIPSNIYAHMTTMDVKSQQN